MTSRVAVAGTVLTVATLGAWWAWTSSPVGDLFAPEQHTTQGAP